MNKQEQLKYMVHVGCMTYNHVNYITDAMNGFTMQKTTFPYVSTILDDASMDGEQKVIKDYLQEHFDLEDKSVVRNEETDDYVLAFAQHKINKYCFFAVIFLKENHYSQRKSKAPYLTEWMDTKYIALCEGDDYWTDPYKLQKQVDYLEEHPECGLIYTNSMIYKQNLNSFFRATLPKQSDFQGLLLESPIMTLTTCFREDLYKRYFEEIERNPEWLMGDLPLWLFIASQSDIKYLPDVTSVYRILDNSASHSKDVIKRVYFCMNSYEIRTYFAKEYHCNHLKKQICINHINELFKIAVDADCNLSAYIAKICYKESIFSPYIWFKMLMYSFPMGRKLHSVKYKK